MCVGYHWETRIMINAVVIVYVFAYEILRVIYRDSFTLYSRFARHQNVSFFFFFIDTDFLFYFIESTRVVLICNINREEKGKNTIQHVSLVCVCTFKWVYKNPFMWEFTLRQWMRRSVYARDEMRDNTNSTACVRCTIHLNKLHTAVWTLKFLIMKRFCLI